MRCTTYRSLFTGRPCARVPATNADGVLVVQPFHSPATGRTAPRTSPPDPPRTSSWSQTRFSSRRLPCSSSSAPRAAGRFARNPAPSSPRLPSRASRATRTKKPQHRRAPVPRPSHVRRRLRHRRPSRRLRGGGTLGAPPPSPALRRQARRSGAHRVRSQGAVASQSSPHDEQRRRVRVPGHAARAPGHHRPRGRAMRRIGETLLGGPDVPAGHRAAGDSSRWTPLHTAALSSSSPQNVDVTAAVELCLTMVGACDDPHAWTNSTWRRRRIRSAKSASRG